MSNWETVLLGVPSGIVSAFLVWLSLSTWATVFTPWLRKQIYRGVEVQGEWTCSVMFDDEGNLVNDIANAVETINYVLHIEKQFGHILNGWFSQSYKNDNTESQGRYLVRGQIMDGVVMVSLTPHHKGKSTFGTLLMYVVASGGGLDGKFTYKGAKTNQINSTDISLIKRL
ncbi:hypothetical protein [Photobacterium damselae]|uniref:hypothetical protein n=1 Tax=Photobacterium damselae TaxID=38293 RepID=UPI002F3E8694